MRKKGRIYLVKRFHINAVFASMKNGVPQSIAELSVAFVMVVFNHTLKALADTEDIRVSYLATYSIIMYVGVVCITILISCSQGIQPIASYNYGAGAMRRVKGIYAFGVIFATIMGVVVYGLFMSVDSHLVRLFLKEGQESMRVYFIGYIFLGVNIVSAIFFQSIQRPKSSFIITISYNFVFVIIFLFVLSHYYGVFGVWLSYPLSLACSSIVVLGVVVYEMYRGALVLKRGS